MVKNEELSTMELEAFAKLAEVQLPTGLENLIVDRLGSENLFGKRQKEVTMNNWIYTAAASIAFFVIGYFLAPALNNDKDGMQVGQDGMSPGLTKYALLLYEDESFIGDDKELVVEYSKWGQSWGQKGKVIGGEKLSYTSKWYGTDFDDTQPPGILSGFFIIQAENYEEALAITETHPHTNYGGRIELREIEKL